MIFDTFMLQGKTPLSKVNDTSNLLLHYFSVSLIVLLLHIQEYQLLIKVYFGFVNS